MYWLGMFYIKLQIPKRGSLVRYTNGMKDSNHLSWDFFPVNYVCVTEQWLLCYLT